MRITRRLAVAGVVALAAAGSVGAAWLGAVAVERRSVAEVELALAEGDAGFAAVRADGLRVVLTGVAPDEAARFRAVAAAGEAVDPARVVDAMRVAPREAVAPPRVSLQMLRNETGVSLIGLVPEATRDALAGELAGLGEVSLMVEATRHAPPDGWAPALAFALRALRELPRAAVGVEPGAVEIVAVAETDERRRALEAALEAARPEGVALALDVSGPLPVASPFAARFVMDGAGARFELCAADDEAARERVLAAARAAGLEGAAECPLALGAPTPRWGEAVAAGIEAVAALGAGRLEVTDTEVVLRAGPGAEPAAFEAAAARLGAALPPLYALQAVGPAAEQAAEGAPEAPEMVAARDADGVRIAGHLGGAMQRDAALSYARALFGAAATEAEPRAHDALPEGWSARVLAGLEALSHVSEGTVRVSAEAVALEGRTGDREAETKVAALLAERLGAGAEAKVAVTYDEALDPLRGIPTPEECVTRLNAVLEAEKLAFAPGEAVIGEGGSGQLSELATHLGDCARSRFEVEGHTDSQGREVMNLELSQARAEAVRTALIGRGVPPSQLVAKGYGEARPIADNGTEAGRQANRRISFSLVGVDGEARAAAQAERDG